MRTITRTTFLFLVLAGTGALGAACASKPKGPAVPVELDGTKWKLVALGGKLDGRVVEFKRKGKDGYIGTLAEPGRILREVVGIEIGREIFSIRRKDVNQYEGVYKGISGDGNISEREVVVFIDGDTMTWNQESAVWERINE